MWNKTSCAYSKNATGSVNSAAQYNSASSASASVKQRYRCAVRCGTRCNGFELAHEPLKNTGSVAETYTFDRVMVTRTTGIAKILSQHSPASAHYKNLHTTFFRRQKSVDYVGEVSSASTLLIRLSWVRPPHVPPTSSMRKPQCHHCGFFLGRLVLCWWRRAAPAEQTHSQ